MFEVVRLTTQHRTAADRPYDNCRQAHAVGRYNISKGDPDFRPKLDRDRDGIACEG